MRIGSLFSGVGGLELGVQAMLGGDVAWHCENDPAAAKVLAHHWPEVSNLGDITAVDWSAVAPVDVLTGGSPCQDVSSAGKRVGLRPGTRSGLWASMCDAVEMLRPGLVVWENVRGVLSAGADSALESCPVCVGDRSGVSLRALGRVVGDLAELGYDARWGGVRAADAGAPHGRFRVFVAAWPATDTQRHRRPGWRESGAEATDPQRKRPRATPTRPGAEPVTNAESDGRHEAWPESAGLIRGLDVAECGLASAADTGGGGRERRPQPDVGPAGGLDAPLRGDADRCAVALDWGQYGTAISRWERVLDRLAPPPTEPGTKGQPRLSALFVEWLMGLPTGWVTGVPGVSRNDQLRCLGNGVVPQQAALALRLLMPVAAR